MFQEQENDTEDDNLAESGHQDLDVPMSNEMDVSNASVERSVPSDLVVTSSSSGVSTRVSRHQLQAAIAQAQGFLTTGRSGGSGPQLFTSASASVRSSEFVLSW